MASLPTPSSTGEELPRLEDFRGVDISQIRAQLRMSVPDRVRTMVAAANTMIALKDSARQCSTELEE